MLNNQDWDKPKTKSDVRSLASLIEWLETKDPKQSYNYSNGRACLCAQYFKDKGFWFVGVDAYHFQHGFLGGITEPLPSGFNTVAMGYFYSDSYEHTFGAALLRARECQSYNDLSANIIDLSRIPAEFVN